MQSIKSTISNKINDLSEYLNTTIVKCGVPHKKISECSHILFPVSTVGLSEIVEYQFNVKVYIRQMYGRYAVS